MTGSINPEIEKYENSKVVVYFSRYLVILIDLTSSSSLTAILFCSFVSRSSLEESILATNKCLLIKKFP